MKRCGNRGERAKIKDVKRCGDGGERAKSKHVKRCGNGGERAKIKQVKRYIKMNIVAAFRYGKAKHLENRKLIETTSGFESDRQGNKEAGEKITPR